MAKSYLFVLNDAPYGNERAYNALRWAAALNKREPKRVRVFLQGDAVGCALAGSMDLLAEWSDAADEVVVF